MNPLAHLLLGATLVSAPAMASPWSLDELFELEGQAGMVTDTAYSPDGSVVVSADVKGQIFAWDPRSGARRWQLAEDGANFSRVTISQDGRLAAVVGLRFVGVIDLAAGVWAKKLTLANGGALSAVAFSDSSRLLAVGDTASHVWLIDLASGWITDFAAHDWGIMDLRFMDEDQFLLAGDATSVRVWNVEDGSERRIVDTAMGDIPGMYFLSRMAFSDDGRLVIVSSGNDAVLFDLAARQLVQTFRGHDKEVIVVRVTPDLANVITSSRDHTTRVWDVETGETTAQATALDLSLTSSIGVSPAVDQFIMSAALFDIFGGTVRTKLAIWAINPSNT